MASGAGSSHHRSFPPMSQNAAVIRLSEELAAETERHGVAVFAIDPGWMSTAMTAYLAGSPQGLWWTPSARSLFGTEAHVPPSRAADLVAALATDKRTILVAATSPSGDDLDDLLCRTEEIRRNGLLRVPSQVTTLVLPSTCECDSGPTWRLGLLARVKRRASGVSRQPCRTRRAIYG